MPAEEAISVEEAVYRSEILRPGTYAPMPHAILRRRDLCGTAKLAAVAILDHLRPGHAWAWPSLGRVSRMIGCSRCSTRRGLRELVEVGILLADEQPGRVTRYSIGLQADWRPDSGPKDRGGYARPPSGPLLRLASYPSQNDTGIKMRRAVDCGGGPVSKCYGGGLKLRPHPSQLETRTTQ